MNESSNERTLRKNQSTVDTKGECTCQSCQLYYAIMLCIPANRRNDSDNPYAKVNNWEIILVLPFTLSPSPLTWRRAGGFHWPIPTASESFMRTGLRGMTRLALHSIGALRIYNGPV